MVTIKGVIRYAGTLLVAMATSTSPSFAEARVPGGELMLGRWVGYLQPEGRQDALALTMDSYLYKPDGIDAFQRLELFFRVSLGGFASSEYETQRFDAVNYSFDLGVLALDEPENEMIVTAVVYSDPTVLEGEVLFRSTGQMGRLVLRFQSDEPGEGGTGPLPPLAPTLSGQYEGLCGDESAVLQIETARGLADAGSEPNSGFHDYQVTGALGIDNGLCSAVNGGGRPVWCVDHAFSSGRYDYYQGRLFLSGTLETNECQRDGHEFACRMRIIPRDGGGLLEKDCRFRRVDNVISEYAPKSRSYHVAASEDQRQPLPDPRPPANAELVNAAKGSFFGYLHNETTGLYEPLRLNVVATNSSVNPHNENVVHVSVTSVLYFGRGQSPDLLAQQYDRRALYVVPGFILSSDATDSFLQVTTWQRGLVTGVWYSREFGRVGTFQAVKSDRFPTLDARAATVPSVVGQFHGPSERSADGREFWDATLLVPIQPRTSAKSLLLFQGNSRLTAAGVAWPSIRITDGAYDFYSGALAWMVDAGNDGEARRVTGRVGERGELKLFWPNERAWAVSIFDRELGTYTRMGLGR